jgi:putative ABC transport system ATP-binding protein
VIYEASDAIRAGSGLVVKLVQVSKEYLRGGARVTALQDVTLEVPKGEFCAILGPSGCGKSTLLNVVSGVDRPTGGEILLDGRSTRDLPDREWTRLRREFIGMVFQAFHLLPSLTAAENVALPLILSGVRGAEVNRRVSESLEAVRMRHRERHRPGELSGGEQQRVAIARALVHQPRLILADEPTGNLDSSSGAEVVALLRALPGRGGHTVMMVTHSDAAVRQADRVYRMRDGRIEA